MSENIEIKIKEGLNELKFGLSMDEVKKILGNPDEESVIEDPEGNVHIWFYDEAMINVYFEEFEEWRCVSIGTDNPDAVLLGKKIYALNETKLRELFKQNGFNEIEEEEEMGEKRISFDEAIVDVFFAEGEIVEVNWGVNFNDDGNPIWPAKV